MSKISLAPDASGSGIFTIASPNSNTNRTLTLPDDTGTIVTNSGNQAGSFTTLNTSGAVVFNDAGADVDFRVESDTVENALFVDGANGNIGVGRNSPGAQVEVSRSATDGFSTMRWSNTGASGKTYEIGLGGNTAAAGFANNLYFYDSTAAATRMVIDSAGKVLIGASSADIASSSQAVVIGSEGFGVGFGATTGTYLKINPGDANGVVNLTADARSGNYPAITFTTSATERMRITSGGNLLVGCTSVPTFVDATGFGFAFDRTFKTTFFVQDNPTSYACTYFNATSYTSGTAYFAQFRVNGSTVGDITSNGSSTSYVTSSDYRLKENVAPMAGALAKVLELNPVTYTWKVNGSAGEGFIAHELQAVCPDAVSGEKDATEIQQVEVSPAVPATYDDEGNELTPAVEAVYEEREVPKYQGVDTSFLVATLTAAIQELSAKNDALEARIAALETGA
jgi:hypothetical protein